MDKTVILAQHPIAGNLCNEVTHDKYIQYNVFRRIAIPFFVKEKGTQTVEAAIELLTALPLRDGELGAPAAAHLPTAPLASPRLSPRMSPRAAAGAGAASSAVAPPISPRLVSPRGEVKVEAAEQVANIV